LKALRFYSRHKRKVTGLKVWKSIGAKRLFLAKIENLDKN
jgi:hypothetical protein